MLVLALPMGTGSGASRHQPADDLAAAARAKPALLLGRFVLAGVVLLLIPLMVLHFTPTLSSFVQDLARPATTTSSIVRRVGIFMGVLAIDRRADSSAFVGA